MGLHLDLLIKKVWFCVFVFALIRRCSLEEATSSQMEKKKKEEAVSHILYKVLFQLHRSYFHVLRVI